MERDEDEPDDPSGSRIARSLKERRDAVETIREEMEALGAKVRDLVLRQPPLGLLGYLVAELNMACMRDPVGSSDEPRPDKDTIRTFQFVLEYVHAVWSSHASLLSEQARFDHDMVNDLKTTLRRLEENTMLYCIGSSGSETELWAKCTWTAIRGHRYQVLEEEFFQFVLEPHDIALRQAYGVGFIEIASGIQSIADAFRIGISSAAKKLAARADEAYQEVEASGASIETIVGRLNSENSSYVAELSNILHDIFLGGVCNLSRHANLPRLVLEDLSYEPGQNNDFFAEGPFSGTPMRTLPARIKPGIKLGDEFYATDGQFVRDSAYRAIQWGLWKRLPYRDEWLKRQGRIIEQAYPRIFSEQLKGARKLASVYYRDTQTGQWAETDLLIIISDVMFVIESKAGVMPMQSPATDFTSHERVINKLIVEAYRQCKRFLEYFVSASEVLLYKLEGDSYAEVARIRQDQFRLILPIGLTVEAFTPFSATAKELPEVNPILGKHPFISMSVDNLFVMRRLLPTTGELIHYLEVRQQVAGLKGAMLFDEIDHLGAYLIKNRFDFDLREQLKEADLVNWSDFSDIVDHYFQGENWSTTPPPAQPFPAAFANLLRALDRLRPNNWLRFDSMLRDYGHSARENIGRLLDQLVPTLAEYPQRRFLIRGDKPLQIWLRRKNTLATSQEILFQAQVGCLTVGASDMQVIIVAYSEPERISGLCCSTYRAPSILQTNYSAILNEAERQRARITG